MSLLCTTCVTIGSITDIDLCDYTSLVDTGDSFVFVKCSFVFTDISDPTVWTAGVASGDIRIVPHGFWAKAAPSQTSFDVSCSETVTTQQGSEYVYNTNSVEAATLEEQDVFKDIRDNYRGWLVLPITCAGVFIVDDSFRIATAAVGESPGQKFYFTQPPDWTVDSGRDQLTGWTMSMVIPKNGIDCRRYLPGVKAALFAI